MAEPTHTASTANSLQGRARRHFRRSSRKPSRRSCVWLAIAFVLLYVLMAKLALPRVGSIIESRQKHIEDDVADASRLKGKSDAAVAAYEKAWPMRATVRRRSRTRRANGRPRKRKRVARRSKISSMPS